MKLRVEGMELKAKLRPEGAAVEAARPVIVLEDGRTLCALDAVVRGVELVSATSEELEALLKAGYVLTGTGLTQKPQLPWRRGQPVTMEVLRESPHGDRVSAADTWWVVEWRTEGGEPSFWVGAGATAEEALADARAECYALQIESGELVVHKLQRDER